MTTHLTDTQKQTIRIALAKWMGWTDINFYEDNAGPGFWNGYPPPTLGVDKNGDWVEARAKHHAHLPNYPASLDACHSIEVKLTDDKHSYFSFLLTEVLVQNGLDPLRHKVSAKAEHRSLALFRALNLGELGD